MSPVRLLPYLLISFGLTWGLALIMVLFPEPVSALFGPITMTNPLFLLAVYAPAIAALILVFRSAGFAGLKRFLGRLLVWRVHPGWYLLALLGPPLIMSSAAWLGSGLAEWSMPYATPGGVLAALGTALIIGPVEELGWRGLMLPTLQQRHTPFLAGLIVGGVWTLWHVPAFLIGGTPQSGFDFLPFVVGTVSVAMIMTVMFNDTGGSLLLPVLMHFQLNNPLTPDAQPWDSVAFLALAVLLVWRFRSSMFCRTGNTMVVPAVDDQESGLPETE